MSNQGGYRGRGNYGAKPHRSKLDVEILYSLSTSLHYLMEEDEKQSVVEKSTKTENPETVSKAKYILNPGCNVSPAEWKPVLSMKSVLTPNSVDEPESVRLTTREMFPIPGLSFVLEDTYELQGSYPRSLFVVMQQNAIRHSFIFDFPDHPWFHDLFGLRKSTYITLKELNSDEEWQMHLKPSRDRSNIFGYMIKHSDLQRIVREQQGNMLKCRKLPLVLDLDDTLVRLVGNEPGRYVPEEQTSQVQHRVRELRDGRKVVLTEHVHEFLDWAQKYFEISVCSLGDQNYVDMVAAVLDPERTRIRGILYSARQEYEFIAKSNYPRRPPKDLFALYAFCAVSDQSLLGSSFSLPLIIDDLTHMWPKEQHDNIIVVKEQRNAPVWTVALFPVVQNVLYSVYCEFFRQLDLYNQGHITTPPSAVTCYKEYLRSSLRDQISAAAAPSPAS